MAAVTPLQRRIPGPAVVASPRHLDPVPVPAPAVRVCPTAQSAYYELLASCQRDQRMAWVQQLRAEGPPRPVPADGALGWLAFRDHHRAHDDIDIPAARTPTP